MRLTSRLATDDDVIRARLRALLSDRDDAGGWVPDEDLEPAADPPGTSESPESPVDRRWSTAAVSPAEAAIEQDEPPRAELPAGIGRHRPRGRAVRLDPGRRGARSLWAAGLAGALVLVAWTWWQRPQVHSLPQPATASASPAVSASPRTPSVGEAARTSATVVVSVVGDVARPGLVTLRTGARVADAIEAAGGVVPGTDVTGVNLAAVLSDGQQIVVGDAGTSSGGLPSGAAAGAAGSRVDINSATIQDLDTLPGVGPVLAQRIVDYRKAHGPFSSVDGLADVPGIGPAVYARLADRIRT